MEDEDRTNEQVPAEDPVAHEAPKADAKPITGLDVALLGIQDEQTIKLLFDADFALKDNKHDDAISISIRDAMSMEWCGKPIKFIGTFSKIANPAPLKIGDKSTSIIALTIKGQSGEEVVCFPIVNNQYGKDLTECFKDKVFIVLYGSMIPVFDGSRGHYKFYLKRYFDFVNAYDLIQAKPAEIKEAEKLALSIVKSEGTIVGYIKRLLIKEIGIHGIERTPELEICIDFMILQSLSDGVSSKNSFKLHSLVIGPPAVGKKLLTIIAKILNPVCEEVSSNSGKITSAGLVGNVTQTDGVITSNPGYIPRASSGVLCIQDFHSITKKRQEVLATFSEVMEDGKVTDSTMARQSHFAATSIHVDTNKYSQVDPKRKKRTPRSDIDIPDNILSRFDFIMEIPADLEGQITIATKMAGGDEGKKMLFTLENTNRKPKWKRELKLLVAYARTYGMIDIEPKYTSYIQAKLKELVESTDRAEYLTNMIIRLSVSIDRFVKAITMSHLKLAPTYEIIDYAFELIEPKISYLARISGEAASQHNLDKKGFIYESFAGQTFTVKDVQEAFVNHGIRISPATIYRYLNEIAVNSEQGFYTIEDKVAKVR